MTLHAFAVPTFTQMLKGLAGQLDKGAQHAAAQGLAAETLIGARLAPDMFPLGNQVRFTCYQATDAVAKLAGLTGPGMPQAEASFADLQGHIAAALAFIDSAPVSAFVGAEDRDIIVKLPGDVTLGMNGLQFLRDWALAQFYFHAVTAYDILRHNGVELGKRDFVPHALAYFKPNAA